LQGAPVWTMRHDMTWPCEHRHDNSSVKTSQFVGCRRCRRSCRSLSVCSTPWQIWPPWMSMCLGCDCSDCSDCSDFAKSCALWLETERYSLRDHGFAKRGKRSALWKHALSAQARLLCIKLGQCESLLHFCVHR
jgi:hypothetical protein